MTILWLKALHLFFILAWMSGMFYLPRLFVYHSQTEDQNTRAMFKTMERRLWWFVTPFALLSLILGVAIIYLYGREWFAASKWLHIKLTLVTGLYAYHFYLFKLLKDFANDNSHHSTKFYRFLNEAPVFAVLAVVVLAVVKPG